MLRMSVGVHSGSYGHFLVGGSHREFLIGGPAATTVVAMEANASAGQILLSRSTAELLPRRCLGAGQAGGILLARSPVPGAWAEQALTDLPPADAVAECLSTAVRAHLTAAPAAPEHRTATVAFLQYGGADELIAKRGVRAAAAALDTLVRAAQEAADRYAVCFLASDVAAAGGKLLFSAGAPRVVGDDEERMLLAMRQIVAADLSLPVRVGINRGYTFTGEVGPPYRRTYVVMGDVVNLAARLTAKSRWGSVLATPGVLAHSRMRFAATAVPPFLVKGKHRPIAASQVGPATRTPALASSSSCLPFIGREPARERIRQSIANATASQGRLVEVVGDAGSGKSRLLAEAASLARGMDLVHTTCEPYTQAMPYISWREPLRHLLGVSWDESEPLVGQALCERVEIEHPELVPWLPLLGIAAGVELPSTREVQELSPDFRTEKLHEVVLRFLAPALTRPTLMVLENAHLMDDASVGLLRALGERLSASSWLVLVARRDIASGFAAGPPAAGRIELEPLSPAAAAALAEAVPEADAIPPHVLELAVERCGGNPGFLLELLAAAAAGSDVLPDRLEAAASARIDALDAADRGLARRASVLGLSFRPSRLRHVLEPGQPAPDAAAWERLSDLIVAHPDGYLRFRTPIVCEAAYLGLPFSVRRTLHAAVARVLEADLGREVDADPAVVSMHFSLAGDHRRAWDYALMGAERAKARFAHADAARLYRRAITAGQATGTGAAELALAWESLGEELRLTGEPKTALEALGMARRLLAGDPVGQARLFHRHADIAERHDRLPAAVRWLRRGLRALEGVDGDEAEVWRARLIADLGGVRMRGGRVAEAISLSREAIARAEAIGELRALARAW